MSNRREFMEQAGMAMGALLTPIAFREGLSEEKARPASPEGPLPDWMRSARMFVADGHQFNTREQHIDIRELCRTVAGASGTVIRMSAHTFMGYVYYDSKYGSVAPKAPGLGVQDWFAEAREECDRHGIKLIGYFSFAGYMPDNPLYGKFDAKDEKGQVLGYETGMGDGHREACLNWPEWRGLNLKIMEEAVQKYSLDGIYTDWMGYPTCYCEQCRQRFQADAGIPIPDSTTLAQWGVPLSYPGFDEGNALIADPATRKYAEWKSRLTAEMIIEIFARVRALKPNILTLHHLQPNSQTVPYYAGTLAEGGERNRPDWLWHTGYLANSSSMYSVPFFTNLYNNTGVSKREYKLRCAQVFANGSYPAVIPAPLYDHRPLDGAREVFRLVDKYPQYFEFEKSQPVRFLAFPHSPLGYGLIRDALVERRCPIGVDGQLTSGAETGKAELISRGWPATEESRFDSARMGAYGALALSGIPVSSLMPEHFLEQFSGYRALCLADEGSMSDAQVERVRRFVADGGGLVATHETSLYRDDGSKRADFALADVMGLHYAATDKYWGVTGGYRVHFEVKQPHPVNQDLYPGLRIRNCDLVVSVRLDGAESIASIVQPHGALYPDSRNGHVGTLRDSLMAGVEIGPAVTVHQFGKGRVVYFAGRPGSMYLHWAIPEMRTWMRNAVDWISRGEVPARVNAQAPVSVGLFRQPARYVLHLVNMAVAATPVDEVPDLNNLELSVQIPSDVKLGRVWGLVADKDLAFRLEGGAVRINLPVLHEYEVVALEHA